MANMDETNRKKALADLLYVKGHPIVVAAMNRLNSAGGGGGSNPSGQTKLPRRTGGNFFDKVIQGFS
jgi:hypothetical protein